MVISIMFYYLQKELGSGVFGTVYHGQIKVDPDDGSPIAAKRGPGGELSSPMLQVRGKAAANVDVAIKVVPLVNTEEPDKTDKKDAEQLLKKKDKRREKQRSAFVGALSAHWSKFEQTQYFRTSL